MSDSDLLNQQYTELSSTLAVNYQYDDIGDESLNDLDNNIESSKEHLLDESVNNPSSTFSAHSSNRSNDHLDDFSHNSESNEFRIMIVCIGLLIVSIGILSNLLFSLLVIFRKRKRQTSTSLLMFSMCLAYFIFLIFHCFKISIYYNIDTVIKFHIYDITENWIYGSFMCKFISGLPICCKLISRLSIFVISFKRIINLVLCQDTNQESLNHEQSDLDVNIIDKKTKKNSAKQNEPKKCKTLKKLFECPLLFLVILIIWLSSLSASLPVFKAFKLTLFSDTAICDSTYDFPNDLKKFSLIYFYYLVYALAVPCVFILIFLILLCILSSRNLASRPSSSLSSSQSTPSKKIKSNSNLSNNQKSCTQANSNNNLLLWFMFIIHLSTSLPQEIYRYLQLIRYDFSDKNFLESYLEMTLEKPLIRARPYYTMQLLYISEFALIPLVFILFFSCTTRKNSSSRSFLTSCFYDNDLIKNNFNNSRCLFNDTTDQSLNDALLDNSNTTNNNVQLNDAKVNYNSKKSNSSLKPTPFELAANSNSNDQSYGFNNINNNNNNNNNNENVLHIIQHPSWRINIKQQSVSANNNNNKNSHLYTNEDNNSGSIQLPFSYMKTNM